VALGYFSEDVGDLLRHLGHMLTNLDRLGPVAVTGSATTWPGWAARSCVAWRNAPLRDLDDLVEPSTGLLSQRGLTARLSDAIAQRAHHDHTYDPCVTAILEQLS
jgi:hypothetical protein